MNTQKFIPIVFYCDDQRYTAVSTAIVSMLASKKHNIQYEINVVCFDLSSEEENTFYSFASEQAKIRLLHLDGKPRIQDFPDLLSDHEKILYLDSDILVREDLSDLFHTELGTFPIAAVIDSDSLAMPVSLPEPVCNYFLSDIMLLNLAALRAANISDAFHHVAENYNTYNLTEQDLFNLVFNGRILSLSIRYNLRPANLLRLRGALTLQQINNCYQTSYTDEAELFSDHAIVHFTDEKPWDNFNILYSDDWYRFYLLTPCDHFIKRGDIELSISQSKITVIIPVYNAENYLSETLDSILSQSLREIEIICINDGSTDSSSEILERYAAKDSRILVLHQQNQGQGAARNKGIRRATGKYLYFMDSDDLLESDCLKICYESAEWNNLDLVLFDGKSFYETPELEEQYPGYKTLYHRKHVYPGVQNGEELFVQFSLKWALIISPCMRLYRTEYIKENNIFFPERRVLEDNLFSFLTLITAKSALHIPFAPYLRRVRSNSVMTAAENYYEKCVAYYLTSYEIMQYVNSHQLSERALYASGFWIYRYFSYGNNIIAEHFDDAMLEQLNLDPRIKPFTPQMLEPFFLLTKKSFQQRELTHSPELQKTINSLSKKLTITASDAANVKKQLQQTKEHQATTERKLRQANEHEKELDAKLHDANRKIQNCDKEISSLKKQVKVLKQKNTALISSHSYRLGHALLCPVGKLKQLLKSILRH